MQIQYIRDWMSGRLCWILRWWLCGGLCWWLCRDLWWWMCLGLWCGCVARCASGSYGGGI